MSSNPFLEGFTGPVSKHLIGYHTRPGDRHTRDEHQGLRAAKGRLQAEYSGRLAHAEGKAEEKWKGSRAGRADQYARDFNASLPPDKQVDIPENPELAAARDKARRKAMNKPRMVNLSTRSDRLDRKYRNKPIQKNAFGVEQDPVLEAVSKGSVEQGLRMVAGTGRNTGVERGLRMVARTKGNAAGAGTSTGYSDTALRRIVTGRKIRETERRLSQAR